MANSEALTNAHTPNHLAHRKYGNLMHRIQLSVLSLALMAIVSGCGGSKVTLNDPTIPEPLIDKLPMKVGARYPESFDHFVHEETVIGKEKWSIDLGASNRILFTQLFSSMFTDFQIVEADTDPSELGLDAFIEPTIDAFEFSVPHQSQTEEFAVWIRYRIKVYDRNGVMVANVPISAYGKSLTTTMGGTSALKRAAVLAMRDAAALMIIKFDGQSLFASLGNPSTQLPAVAEEKGEDEAEAESVVLGGSSNE